MLRLTVQSKTVNVWYIKKNTLISQYNSDIIHFINYTSAFLTLTCHNIYYEKGLLKNHIKSEEV